MPPCIDSAHFETVSSTSFRTRGYREIRRWKSGENGSMSQARSRSISFNRPRGTGQRPTRVRPAFSKTGFTAPIAARHSTNRTPTLGSVSRTNQCPNPQPRTSGCITNRRRIRSSRFNRRRLRTNRPFVDRLRSANSIGAWANTRIPRASPSGDSFSRNTLSTKPRPSRCR